MTLPFAVEVMPVLWVFGGWAAFSLAYFVLGVAASSTEEPEKVSPFASERSAAQRLRESRRSP